MTSCLHIGLLCLVVHLVEGLPTCTDVDGKLQFFDGTHCKPCPTCRSGYGLSETCGNGQGVNAVCKVCPQGHFSDDESMEMCRSCRICSNTMEDAVPCTSTSDRKCGQCSCGFFRYQERDDHCARCEDENYSHLYDECLLPCPTPTSSIQEPVNIVTPEETSKGPTASLDPLVITLLFVLLGLVLIVTSVVIWLFRKTLLRRFRRSWHQYSPIVINPGPTTAQDENLATVINQPVDEESTSNGCPTEEALLRESDSTKTTAEATCGEVAIGINKPVDEESTSNSCPTEEALLRESDSTTAEAPCGEVTIVINQPVDEKTTSNGYPNIHLIEEALKKESDSPNTTDEPQYDICPIVTKEAQQGATPFFEDGENLSHLGPAKESGSISSHDDHTGKSDTASRDSNSHVEPHSQGLTQSGDIQTEYKSAEFDSKFQQALVATKDIGLESINQKDVELLNKRLHERPELVEGPSGRFHYGKMAKLFDFNDDEIRHMTTAQQVLNQVAARRKEQYTVADLLNILVQSGKCFDVVRKLVDQIVERQQH